MKESLDKPKKMKVIGGIAMLLFVAAVFIGLAPSALAQVSDPIQQFLVAPPANMYDNQSEYEFRFYYSDPDGPSPQDVRLEYWVYENGVLNTSANQTFSNTSQFVYYYFNVTGPFDAYSNVTVQARLYDAQDQEAQSGLYESSAMWVHNSSVDFPPQNQVIAPQYDLRGLHDNNGYIGIVLRAQSFDDYIFDNSIWYEVLVNGVSELVKEAQGTSAQIVNGTDVNVSGGDTMQFRLLNSTEARGATNTTVIESPIFIFRDSPQTSQPTANVINASAEGGQFIVEANATDPEGDNLTYLLYAEVATPNQYGSNGYPTKEWFYVWNDEGFLPSGSTVNFSIPVQEGQTVYGGVQVYDVGGSNKAAPLSPYTVGPQTINTAPTVDTVSITPTSPLTTDDLTLTCSGSDANNDSLTYDMTLYRDGTSVQSYSNSSGSETYSSGSTAEGEQYILGCVADDGADTSAQLNSTAVNIDISPTMVNATITPTELTTADNLTLTCTGNDTDSTSIFYDYIIYEDGTPVENSATQDYWQEHNGPETTFNVAGYPNFEVRGVHTYNDSGTLAAIINGGPDGVISAYNYVFGFYWNGSQWVQDNSYAVGWAAERLDVIEFDGVVRLIGRDLSDNMRAYQRDAGTWVRNDSVLDVATLVADGASYDGDASFGLFTDDDGLHIGITWNVDSGSGTSALEFYDWNGSAWESGSVYNSTIASDSVFYISNIDIYRTEKGQLALIPGSARYLDYDTSLGGTNGYNGAIWNGSTWAQDQDIISGLAGYGGVNNAAQAFAYTVEGNQYLLHNQLSVGNTGYVPRQSEQAYTPLSPATITYSSVVSADYVGACRVTDIEGATSAYLNSSTVTAVEPMDVSAIACPTTTYPNENNEPSAAVLELNFSVWDPESVWNNTVELTLGAQTKTPTCGYVEIDATHRNYTCNFTINYYDDAGSWTASATSNNGLSTDTASTTCDVGQLVAAQRDTNVLTFSDAAPGITDARSDNAIVIRNTGNVDVDVSLTGYDLTGQQTTDSLAVSAFKAGETLGSAVQLVDSTSTNISVSIPAGLDSSSNIWLWLSMPSSLSVQDYSSTQAWEVSTAG